MSDALLALLPHVFTASVFAVMGSMTLAGLVRALRRAPGQALHALTLVSGGIATAVLVLLAIDIDTGSGVIAGFAAAVTAGVFWLIGALVARVRPAWVDLLVIVSTIAFFASYAAMSDHAGEVARVFPGLTLPAPDTPP